MWAKKASMVKGPCRPKSISASGDRNIQSLETSNANVEIVGMAAMSCDIPLGMTSSTVLVTEHKEHHKQCAEDCSKVKNNGCVTEGEQTSG